MKSLAASSRHRFHRLSKLLPEIIDTVDSHGQTDRLSMSSEAKKQFPKRSQSLYQVDTRDASS